MTKTLLPVLYLASALATAAALGYALVATPKGQIIVSGLSHPVLALEMFLALIAAGLWAGRMGGPALWTVPLSLLAGLATGLGVALHHPQLAMEPLGGAFASASVLGLVAAWLPPWRAQVPVVAGLVAAVGAGQGHAMAMAVGPAEQLLSWAGSLASAAALLGLGVVTGLVGARQPGRRPSV